MNWNSIGERVLQDIRVLDLEGTAEVGREGLLTQRIQRLVAAGDRKFLVNLERLSSIDSAGIGELISAHQLVAQHKGQTVLVNVGARIRRHLSTAGLLSVIDVAETEAAGLLLLSEEP